MAVSICDDLWFEIFRFRSELTGISEIDSAILRGSRKTAERWFELGKEKKTWDPKIHALSLFGPFDFGKWFHYFDNVDESHAHLFMFFNSIQDAEKLGQCLASIRPGLSHLQLTNYFVFQATLESCEHSWTFFDAAMKKYSGRLNNEIFPTNIPDYFQPYFDRFGIKIFEHMFVETVLNYNFDALNHECSLLKNVDPEALMRIFHHLLSYHQFTDLVKFYDLNIKHLPSAIQAPFFTMVIETKTPNNQWSNNNTESISLPLITHLFSQRVAREIFTNMKTPTIRFLFDEHLQTSTNILRFIKKFGYLFKKSHIQYFREISLAIYQECFYLINYN